MKKTFKALKEKYPGHNVMDLKFSFSNEDEEINLETFDQDLTDAIREAKEYSIGSM